MRARRVAAFVCSVGAIGWALLGAPVPSVSAQPCPDIEVVFARGTGEAPGVGDIGEVFVDSLRSQVGGRSVGVYAVNYAASDDFPRAVDGANDARAHVEDMAAKCHNTRMVLGGFSQGAAVIDLVTADPVAVSGFAGPIPAVVAEHVAAVAFFGKPTGELMGLIGAPPTTTSGLYAAKTIDMCAPLDPICTGVGFEILHGVYVPSGMVDEAAAFAASRL